MTPRFHLAAEEELAAAMNAGEARGAGLGRELLREVQRVTELLCKFPDIGEKLNSHRRRFTLTRFPFGVIFRVEGDTLRILAIAHRRQRPRYWHARQ